MREVRNTIDGADIRAGRRCGNSTRQIDLAIDLLFSGFKVDVKDHFDNGCMRESNRLLFEHILLRLDREHHIGTSLLIVDYKNLTIELIH